MSEQTRIHEHIMDADAELQSVIGIMRMNPGEHPLLPRLERAHDHLMRVKHGEDYEGKWAVVMGLWS